MQAIDTSGFSPNRSSRFASSARPCCVSTSARDTKFTAAFDAVFAAAGVDVLKIPAQAPRANAYAERWVRTARTECLDWILVRNARHLNRVLSIYLAHHNTAHRGLDLGIPVEADRLAEGWEHQPIGRVDVLGGLIHEYERAA